MNAHERPQPKHRLPVPAVVKPVDCTCSGWHTTRNESSVPTARLIEVERQIGGCPAEIRALERIAAREW